VLTSLIVEAQKSVVLTAPFVQAEAVLEIGALSEALHGALGRGVELDIMTTRENVSVGPLQEMIRTWPEQVRLFYPEFPAAEVSTLGSHAKFCIRDSDAAYVGSANLTTPGLGGLNEYGRESRQHFEMGLLVGGQIAEQLKLFWNYSVRVGLFARWSGAS
jgi:phosphatidylserine/phosphatidylglycerophosphate/cardiolipin synthase-like enzyme